MDRKTKKVMDAALGLPSADRSALLNRLMMVLGEGPDIDVFEARLVAQHHRVNAGRHSPVCPSPTAVGEARRGLLVS